MDPKLKLDFNNTEVAFQDRTNKELKKTARLFTLMNNNTLVTIGSALGLIAIKLRLPFTKTIIKNTVFDQFCGGTNLLDCQKTIDRLQRMNSATILDYGAEGKSTEEEFDITLDEIIKSLEFAASNDHVPCVSTKITGIANDDLLKKLQSDQKLSTAEKHAHDKLVSRLSNLGDKAEAMGVGLFIDAEESWFQVTIDKLVMDMMHQYNRKKVIIYNTYQLYRNDKFNQLQEDFEESQSNNFMFGAKLVRGAYMDKEREFTNENNTPPIIHENKTLVDKDYNDALKFCVNNYEMIGSCNASHNSDSNYMQAKWIEDDGIVKNHPHLNFCQLYGMSDNITFNLSKKGYNVAKYLPYGPVREVIPYLIRRAQENASLTGDVGRELKLLKDELKRRGLYS